MRLRFTAFDEDKYKTCGSWAKQVRIKYVSNYQYAGLTKIR
jgi:hypothetical protein